MNRKILALALPNIVSNITVPLLGLVDIAIVGHLGDDSLIGGIAIGTAVFNFIYWNFAFLRMGASGCTAQAYGARNFTEIASVFVRALILALVAALLLVVFRRPVGHAVFLLMDGTPQNSRFPMYISIGINVVNLIFCLWFALGLGWGIVGVAWGTVVAQYSGLALSIILWGVYYRRFLRYIRIRECLKLHALLAFFKINRDIFLRTACIVIVYTFFTSASSGMGDTMLAVNTLLMQLFTLFSYLMDGFAYAGEVVALFYTGIYACGWEAVLSLFTESPAILSEAGDYVGWLVVIPLVAFIPFTIDGVLIGATRTAVMRDSVFLSTALFFAVYYGFRSVIGNNALWAAFLLFLIARGILQYFMTHRLKIIV